MEPFEWIMLLYINQLKERLKYPKEQMPFIVIDTFKGKETMLPLIYAKSKSVNLPLFHIIYAKYGKKAAEFPIITTHGFQSKFQSN